MGMPADFVSRILTQGGITDIIGDRIFPLIVPEHVYSDPQDRRPCLVYQTAGSTRGKTFCATDDLISEQFSVDCYAETYDAAKRLGDAVIAGVVDFSGVSGATHIEAVFLDSEFDTVDLEPGLFRRNLALTVGHRTA